MLKLSSTSVQRRFTERNHLESLLTPVTSTGPYIKVRVYIGEGDLYDVDFFCYFNYSPLIATATISYSSDYTPEFTTSFVRNAFPEFFL